MKSLYIAVDFDGTMVKHAYPNLGDIIDEALETVLELMQAGHKIILYTMRSGERLVEAVEYLEDHGVEFYGVNENKTQKYWTESVKVFANIYIDDCSLGIPLITPEKGKPYVDWEEVREILVEKGILE